MRNLFTLTAAIGAQTALADHYFDGLDRLHLRMNQDNHFKIMQLTDMHFGEVGQSDLDHETLQMIRSLIAKEQPDFIAITGDVVSGQAWDRYEKKFWERHYKPLANTLSSLQVPWGLVPGYHDFETDINVNQMLELEQKQKYAASMPNYYDFYGQSMYHQFTYEVPIENQIHSNVTDARLWFFGTGRANCMGSGGMNCIRRDQIEWFKDKSEGLPADDERTKNGIAFMHHGLQEHMTLANHYPVYGQKRDKSRCQAVNTGLFSEIKHYGTIQWVSAGGDHSSDFYGNYAGVTLGYGRKTGFASFGPKFVQRGARVFDLSVDQDTGKMTVETWIRQQDGEVDYQEEQRDPPLISYLKSDHCLGAEETDSTYQESGWIPDFF